GGYQEVNAVEGRGCEECAHTGYRGRSGVYELLPVTDAVKGLILERASAGLIKEAGVKQGVRPLREDGWRNVRDRGTTAGRGGRGGRSRLAGRDVAGGMARPAAPRGRRPGGGAPWEGGGAGARRGGASAGDGPGRPRHHPEPGTPDRRRHGCPDAVVDPDHL